MSIIIGVWLTVVLLRVIFSSSTWLCVVFCSKSLQEQFLLPTFVVLSILTFTHYVLFRTLCSFVPDTYLSTSLKLLRIGYVDLIVGTVQSCACTWYWSGDMSPGTNQEPGTSTLCPTRSHHGTCGVPGSSGKLYPPKYNFPNSTPGTPSLWLAIGRSTF
jgi:hypothetical protein